MARVASGLGNALLAELAPARSLTAMPAASSGPARTGLASAARLPPSPPPELRIDEQRIRRAAQCAILAARTAAYPAPRAPAFPDPTSPFPAASPRKAALAAFWYPFRLSGRPGRVWASWSEPDA